jgi:hypothetical protein
VWSLIFFVAFICLASDGELREAFQRESFSTWFLGFGGKIVTKVMMNSGNVSIFHLENNSVSI